MGYFARTDRIEKHLFPRAQPKKLSILWVKCDCLRLQIGYLKREKEVRHRMKISGDDFSKSTFLTQSAWGRIGMN